jgi:hypothetical protein
MTGTGDFRLNHSDTRHKSRLLQVFLDPMVSMAYDLHKIPPKVTCNFSEDFVKYVIFKTDGGLEILERPSSIELQELQTLVGGYIEMVRIEHSDALALMVNEEGSLLDLPQNPHCPGFVGNVVLGKIAGEDFTGLSDKETRALLASWSEMMT